MNTFVVSPTAQTPTAPMSANRIAQQREDTLRDTAYTIGIGRVADASRLRGWV